VPAPGAGSSLDTFEMELLEQPHAAADQEQPASLQRKARRLAVWQ